MRYFLNTLFILLFSLFPRNYGCSSKKDLPPTPTPPNNNDISTVYDVKKVFEHLADNINEYLDPCDDFLKFTCERWIKRHNFNDNKNDHISTLPDTKYKYNSFVKDVDSGKVKLNSSAITKIAKISKKCDSLKNNRTKFCQNLTKKIKSYPYHVYYFSKYVNIIKLKETINIIEKMIEILKFEMKKIINGIKDIFDDKTKKELIKKLDNMKVNVKFIQKLYDTKYLENCYKNIGFNDKDNVNETYANLLYINQILIDAEDNDDTQCLKLIRNDPLLFVADKGEYFIKYDSKENFIFFTPLLLIDPIFNPNLPFYYNYGTFGTILAHELIDLFNLNENYLYEKEKNKTKVVTEDVKKKFNKKIECFTKQYNKENIDKTIKENKTLQKYVADNGGIKLAHRAYLTYINKYNIKVPKIRGFDKYTQEQLFFITYGMSNCEKYNIKGGNNVTRLPYNTPHLTRVRGSLKNYKPFSSLFKCDKDKKMNPKDKCEFW